MDKAGSFFYSRGRMTPRRHFLFGALALLFLFGAAHFLQWDHGLTWGAPVVLSGDEPHYLIVASSIALDHDLEVGTDYVRVAAGSAAAGVHYRGVGLDHHTILVGPGAHDSKLWHEFCLGGVRDLSDPSCHGYGRTAVPWPTWPYREVMAHPAGWPLLITFAALPFSPRRPEDLEHIGGTLMLLLALLGVLAVHGTARGYGLSERAAAVGALLLAVASPWFPYARSFFSELPAGALLALGFWMRAQKRSWLAGVFLGAAVWLKPPFVLLGFGLGLALWLRRDRKSAFSVLAPMGLLTLGLIAFNEWMARRPLVAGAGGWEWAQGLQVAFVELLDERHGVLLFVPWVVISGVGLFLALRHFHTASELPLALALGVGLYVGMLLAFGSVPGYCYGPRYFVPLLPLLALAAAERYDHAGPRMRRALIVLGVIGALIAVPAGFRTRETFNRPFYGSVTPSRR